MRWSTLSLVVAAIIVATTARLAAAPAARQPAVKPSPIERLEQHFKRADADFKRGDKRAAATELRAAAQVLREQVRSASGPAKKLLESLPGQLDKAASKIGTIDQKALRQTFARVYQTLAAYHQKMASSAWAKRERRKVGAYMQVAGTELRHAATWAGPVVERACVIAAGYALDVSQKLFHDSRVNGEQVEKALTGLGKQIDALGRRIESAK
jgi:hypothetical protein